jgi:hypothetical protein
VQLRWRHIDRRHQDAGNHTHKGDGQAPTTGATDEGRE